MHICLLANAVSVHTQRWARAYAERGHEVTVLSIRQADVPGVRVLTVCAGPVNDRSRAWTALSYARLLLGARAHLAAIAPDVVHAHFTVTHGVIGAFSRFRPLVLSAWGSDVLLPDRGLGSWLYRRLNRYALAWADAVTSTSRFMGGYVRALAPAGRTVHEIPFGVDPDRFRPARGPAAGTDAFRIGFVKSLVPKYGPDVLIRAMPEIVAAIPEARLVIAGEGPMRPGLERLVRDLGLGDRIEFRGFVPNDALPDLLNRLDLFVNCTHLESFGVAVLEASACGLAVVATRVGGVPEVCCDGETALLIDPGDSGALAGAVIRLARDETLRRDMGEAGRRFVLENFVWGDNVEQMLDRLEHLRRLPSGELYGAAE